MPYKTILLHVEGISERRGRLHLAAALANRFEAILIGRAAAQVHPPMGVPGGDAAYVTFEQDDVQEEFVSAQMEFSQIAPLVKQGTQWRTGIALPTQALARDARAADLLLAERIPEGLGRGIYRSVDPAELVLTAGRPVLVVSPGISDFVPERVLIAWKDTREARRAISDAMPFLQRSEDVFVTTVREDNAEDPTNSVQDVAQYLGRHGVSTHADCTPRRANSVADEILARAKRI